MSYFYLHMQLLAIASIKKRNFYQQNLQKKLKEVIWSVNNGSAKSKNAQKARFSKFNLYM